MQINSLVEATNSFDRIRSEWGYNYPHKGDILTVSDIQEHPNDDMRKRGIVLLFFFELPELCGVCDKTIYNEPNFLELQPPMDMEFIQELQMQIV